MYNKASGFETVNGEVLDLFAKQERVIDNIPPTETALVQNTKRVYNMASQVWARFLEPTSPTVDSETWVWKSNEINMCIPFWPVLPKASPSYVQ